MKKPLTALLALMLLLFCLTGCQKAATPVQENTAATMQSFSVEEYLSTVKAQAAILQASLENDDLTQTDMNQKSKELADLWEAALNTLLAEAQKSLSAADYEKLSAEQSAWEAEKTAAVEAAGKEYEGGSMYALVVNSEAAKLTEARVLELAEKLQSSN